MLDLLKQIPVNHSSAGLDMQNLDEWSLSKTEILGTLDLIESVLKTFSDIDKFELVDNSISAVLNECCGKTGIELDISDTLPDIEINKALIELLIHQVSTLLKTITSSSTLKLSVSHKNSSIILEFSSDNEGWPDWSIFNIPPELVSSFLICYHHQGKFSINQSENGSLLFRLDFAGNTGGKEEPPDLEDELEEVLSRFDFWND